MTPNAQRILVVDDEPQILRGLRVILTNAGYRVDAADSVRRRRSTLISVRPPDAAVLDLMLPDGIRGSTSAREVRRWSELPIVVLSAVGDEREKVMALDAGADDYVTKPFGAEELLARLRARASPGARGRFRDPSGGGRRCWLSTSRLARVTPRRARTCT